MTTSQPSKKSLFLYIFVAYTTLVCIKSLFFISHPEALNAFVPIWSGDAGLYGFYAKLLLTGTSLGITAEYMPAYLLVALIKVLPISLDQALFFAPLFVSSLSVIPVLLIGYAYKMLEFSTLVAIVGGITKIYYIRTHVGYYDSDILNVTLSLLIISFLILYLEKRALYYILFAFLSAAAFYFWYHQSTLLIFFIFINFILYLLIEAKKYKWILLFLILSVIVILQSDLHVRFLDYFFQKETLQSINEARPLPYKEFASYYSLPWFYFLAALLALSVFYAKHKSFLLTLPLLFVAALSLQAGMRFAEYGVLVFAFGSIYLIYSIKAQRTLFIFFISLLVLYYISVTYKINPQLQPLLNASSTQKIQELDLNKDDMILTWWDYGWSLWYYTKAQTYIDNGKHFEGNTDMSNLFFMSEEEVYKQAPQMLHEYKYDNIYFMFEEKMLPILRTIASFSSTKKDIQLFNLHNKELKLNLVNFTLTHQNKSFSLAKIYLRSKDIKLLNAPQEKQAKANYVAIVYKNKYLLLIEKKLLHSFIIQALILHKYEQKYFTVIKESESILILKINKK